jgi:hypothetical protein
VISTRVFGTPVKASFSILPIIIVLWAGITWLGLHWHPERGFWQGLLIGAVSSILLFFADFGHAVAHIFSARYAGAPMDEILIAGDMPRTIYYKNDVAPRVHRMRAMGGPIFSIVGFLLSIAIYGIAANHPILREFAAWSALGHGLILIGSMLPLPIVDGGTILKWTLVESGRPEREADRTIQRVDFAIGIAGVILGLGLIVMRMWIAGVIVVGISIVILAVAAGKIQ